MENIFFPSKSSFAVFVWIAAFIVAVSSLKNGPTVTDIFNQSIIRLSSIEMNLVELKDRVASISVIPEAQAAKTVPTNDLICLSENIFYEAGSQSYAGKIAVGHVVLNRVKSPDYPKTVCGVIYEGSQNVRTSSCQFSWTCVPKKFIDKTSSAWYSSKKAAYELLHKKDSIMDITEGATSFHATRVNPSWAKRLTLVTQIDEHIFYKAKR